MFKLDPISWICVCSHDLQLRMSCCIFVSEAQAAQFRAQHHKKSWRPSSLRILQNLSFSKSCRIFCITMSPPTFQGSVPGFLFSTLLNLHSWAGSSVARLRFLTGTCFWKHEKAMLQTPQSQATNWLRKPCRKKKKKKTCLAKTPPPAQHVTASVGTDHEADKAIGFLEAAPALVQLHLHLMAFPKITNLRQARKIESGYSPRWSTFKKNWGKFIKITKIEGSWGNYLREILPKIAIFNFPTFHPFPFHQLTSPAAELAMALEKEIFTFRVSCHLTFQKS